MRNEAAIVETNQDMPMGFEHEIKVEALFAVFRRTNRRFVPVSVSARHLHLSRVDADALFGRGYEPTPEKVLTQPGQFASGDRVAIKGPKGCIEDIRLLGPIRPATQVEISMTDAKKIGIGTKLRISGDLADSPGAILATKARRIEIPCGVIVAARHLHMSSDQADIYGLRDGDVVSLKKSGPRETVFGGFLVRSGLAHEMEAHVDTDEANAAGITDGDLLEIV